jgi:hypothetical protein
MSTLQTLKMLGKHELELLERMCSLCINDDQIPQEVFSLPDGLKSVTDNLKIDFSSLQTLQSLGLFLPNDMTRSIENPEKKNFALQYFDKQIIYKPTQETNFKIALPGFFELSNTGKQIVQHLNSKFLEDYLSWLKPNYKIANYEVTEN